MLSFACRQQDVVEHGFNASLPYWMLNWCWRARQHPWRTPGSGFFSRLDAHWWGGIWSILQRHLPHTTTPPLQSTPELSLLCYVASSISKRPCLQMKSRSSAPAPWRLWRLSFPAASRLHLCKGVLTCHQQPSLYPVLPSVPPGVIEALEAMPGVMGESLRTPLMQGTPVPLALTLLLLWFHWVNMAHVSEAYWNTMTWCPPLMAESTLHGGHLISWSPRALPH